MKKAIEAGGFTEESAALLQGAESKLFGQVGGRGGSIPGWARGWCVFWGAA